MQNPVGIIQLKEGSFMNYELYITALMEKNRKTPNQM